MGKVASAMTEEDLLVLIASIFKLDKRQVTDEFNMEDAESWDSLKHMELIAALEEKIGMELDFDQITEMTSIGNIRRILLGTDK